MKQTLLIIAFAFFSFYSIAQAQNIDVKNLSKSEIERAKKAIQESGLSSGEAEELARQRGATQQQIDDFQQRISKGEEQSAATMNKVIDNAQPKPVEEFKEKVEKRQEQIEKSRPQVEEIKGAIFGSYLFNSQNLTFEPDLTIQTPKNYEIGIGDQLIINIWGNSQNNYQLIVDINGQLMIPDVGPVYVAGMTFDQASEKIIQRLTSIYADMGGKNPETFAQVNMGQLRSVNITIVGEVKTPGTYTLPVTATVFNALFLSGGPNNIGSFRNIKIIRDNELYKIIDVYDFLVDADPSNNINVKNNDVIYIPAVNKKVSVIGEFKRTGIFEMAENETLSDLIRFTSGFKDITYRGKLKIKRKTQAGQQVIDVPLSLAQSTILMDGDKISISKITDRFENRVTVLGSVTRPGEYQWEEGMKLSEIIIKADSIYPDAYLKTGHIIRENPDLTQQLITFNLSNILLGNEDYTLRPEDIVNIKSHFQMVENNIISVSGHVISPGTFPYMDSIKVSDAIYLANGLRDGAFSSGHIIRVNPDRSLHFIRFSINEVLNGINNLTLEKEDIISIKSWPQLKEIPYIEVAGEVQNPSQFEYMENMTLSDALYLADGFTEGADSSFIEIARRLTYKEESQLTDTLVHLFTTGTSRSLESLGADFLLKPYDRVNVRRAPGYRQQGVVTIQGEVKYAGPFAISIKGQRISDLVKMAGGVTPQAFLPGAKLQRNTEELGSELIAIDLHTILRQPGSSLDLMLRHGDIITVPEFMQTVKVTGNVQNPFSLTYEIGKPLKYYINKSGGFNQKALRRKAYVKYPNGATKTTKKILFFKCYPKVQPGSVIVVPEKPERDNSNVTTTMLAVISALSTLAIAISKF